MGKMFIDLIVKYYLLYKIIGGVRDVIATGVYKWRNE